MAWQFERRLVFAVSEQRLLAVGTYSPKQEIENEIRIGAKSGHTESPQFSCAAGNPDLNCRSPPRYRRSLRGFWGNFGGESTRCLNQHDFCANGRHAPMYN